MKSLLLNICKKIRRLSDWAISKNIRPIPFLTVYFVTLALFPLALVWVGAGVSQGLDLKHLAPRVIVAWVLLQAPSLYVLVFGRAIPKYFVVFLVIFVLIVSGWYFAWLGITLAILLISALLLLKYMLHQREVNLCARSLRRGRATSSTND